MEKQSVRGGLKSDFGLLFMPLRSKIVNRATKGKRAILTDKAEPTALSEVVIDSLKRKHLRLVKELIELVGMTGIGKCNQGWLVTG